MGQSLSPAVDLPCEAVAVDVDRDSWIVEWAQETLGGDWRVEARAGELVARQGVAVAIVPAEAIARFASRDERLNLRFVIRALTGGLAGI